MIMGRQPSKFFKIIVVVEVDDKSELYNDDLYFIGRRVEKAIDNNTDMVAWIDSIDPTKGR